MGSDSDLPVMENAAKMLKEFKIPFEMTLASAHRSPERTRRYVKEAEVRGAEVFIAGAGGAAHLAGVIAAETILPVIGVPIDSSPLHGLDALLSTVQMPGGVAVASMAVGKAGAKNAGIFAAQILARKYPEIAERLRQHKASMAHELEEKAGKLGRETAQGTGG
ncbi:MAG TPA: 5-(carboxyamino)imidazole ribonucleotide mutase [Nitrospiria bacterium]|nr:5-(carboxyamino)imidazole ribonucleotide mutase [Nitrospiria bacterium]